MSRFHRPNIGSISTGLAPTKHPQALIDTFIYELRQQHPLHEIDRELLSSLDVGVAFDSITIIDRLVSALSNYAPKGYYFGPSASDSTDFGYWPIEDSSGRNAGSAEIQARQRAAVEVAEGIAEQNIALPHFFDPPTPSEMHSAAEACSEVIGKPQC
jgi:hypothetical protein